MKQTTLTTGNITGSLLRFAFPMMVGNLLQQLYNIVDTLIVGQFLGKEALAAVGSCYKNLNCGETLLIREYLQGSITHSSNWKPI